MGPNGGSETGIADAPDIGGEKIGGLGDHGATNDVFTDLGRRAGSDPHATMSAVLDLPEPPPVSETPPPPAASDNIVHAEAEIAEASAGPMGETPIADEARRAQQAEAAAIVAKAEQDKNSIAALGLPPEASQAAQQILDNARAGKVDFDALSPSMKGLLKDRLTPDEYAQAIKLPDSKLKDAMFDPNNPRVQVVPPSQPQQFEGTSAQPPPTPEPIARFEPGPDDIISAPPKAETPPPPPKEPIIIEGKVVSATSTPIVENNPNRVIPADQMDAAMRQGALDGKATLDQAPGAAKEAPDIEYNADGTLKTPASNEVQGVDPSRAPVQAEIDPNVVDADGYRVLSDDEVTPQQFDSESVAEALAAGSLTKEQADAMPDLLNRARNGEKIDMSNLNSAQQELLKKRLTPDQFSSAIRTDGDDVLEAARNQANGTRVEPALGDAVTEGEDVDPTVLAAGGEGGDGRGGDGNGTTTEKPDDDGGEDNDPEDDNSMEWTETAEEKLARLTNTSIAIEEFDADVAKLSEDQKLQLGEAVINFDQRNELPEDETLRELVIRGAGLHEARNELDAYSAQSPEAKAALGESVTRKKAEKAAAATPEGETPPTPETPDDNMRIMNEIKAEIKAGNLSRRDELARRENRIKDEEEFAKLDAMDAKDMTGKDLDRYNELKEKLKSDPAAPELTKEQIEAMQLKFLEDFISGKAFTEGENGESILTPEAEAALEKINKHQLEQSLQTDHGLSAKDAKEQAKNILDKTSRGERKKLAIEKRVQQKLQELMAMEIQAMGIPQRLENYRKAKKELRTQIEKKEAEIGKLNPGEVKTAKARSELYNMQSRYATIKAEIARSKNIGRQLNAQYKEKMQSVKRDLRLSGRFASLVAWANSRMTDAYTNIAMNIDSIHDSE